MSTSHTTCAMIIRLVCKLIILVDPRCDLVRTVSMIEDATIDRLYTHSVEVITLYPHLETHGLVFPFGWTNCVPTKPINCMTLSEPLRPTPFWSKSWVAPDATLDITSPPSWQNKTVLNRENGTKTIMGTQGYTCLPGEDSANA